MRRFPWLNLVLFLTTVATTWMAGGWAFAVPLIIALGTHEMGHFVVARLHGLEPSWPYFIPAPGTLVGTFGAVIRMRFTVQPTRKQLFDVGIAGPLAGFVVSLVFLTAGAAMSGAAPDLGRVETYSLWDAGVHWALTGKADWFARALGGGDGATLILGDSLLTRAVVYLTTGLDSATVVLHPVAFAGWVGMFVTLLNLLPVGQLDGGHVAYALLGPRFRYTPWVVLPALVVLGLTGWPGWLVWALLLSAIGLRHPPASDEPLGSKRMALAWLCLVIFVLIFTPAPLQPGW